ncbi:unnamed protein product [Calypogeia fissa]
MVEAMDKWRNFIELSGVDIWSSIEHSISLAHSDHYDQLLLRRDRFVELMFAPRCPKGEAGGNPLRRDPSDKSNPSKSGLDRVKQEDNEYEEIVPQRHVEEEREEEEYEDEDEDDRHHHGRQTHHTQHAQYEQHEEEGKEIVHIDSDYEDEEPAEQDAVLHDPFDDDVEALTDDFEREKLLLKEIYSIKSTIDSLPQGRFLPEDEAMDILYRVQELNISVKALKDTSIGKSVTRYRKHPSKAVKAKAKQIVSSWKHLVDEYMESMPAASASANDEAGAVGEEEVGLPSPPLDEGDLIAARTVELSDIFNFSESDLSAASGPSPASDGHQSGRKSSSSPDQELVARESKGVARVLKVDKHRPVHMEGKPDQSQRNAAPSSSSIRKGPNNVPPSGVRPSSGMNGAAAPRMPAGPSVSQRPQQSAGAVRQSDARPTPNVGGIRPRVETTKPGLATSVEPLSSDVSARMEASKRKLHANYMMIENAKKQRTVQPLELTELPKGGPKPQRPGQHRGWVKAK